MIHGLVKVNCVATQRERERERERENSSSGCRKRSYNWMLQIYHSALVDVLHSYKSLSLSLVSAVHRLYLYLISDTELELFDAQCTFRIQKQRHGEGGEKQMGWHYSADCKMIQKIS